MKKQDFYKPYDRDAEIDKMIRTSVIISVISSLVSITAICLRIALR